MIEFHTRGRWLLRRPLAWILFFGLVSTCSRDGLGPDNTPFTLSSTAIHDSVALGSVDPQVSVLAIGGEAVGTRWTASIEGNSPWLALSHSSGSSPDSLDLIFDPNGLAVGLLNDVLVVVVSGKTPETFRIPITLVVHPCIQEAISPGQGTVTTELSGADCGAPDGGGGFADVYQFGGQTGDTISIKLSTSDFDSRLVLDTVSPATSTPIASAVDCRGQPGDACFVNQILPVDATYFLEATSAVPGAGGSYALDVMSPVEPNAPSQLAQLNSDNTTPIAVGGTASSNTVVFTATITDPDSFDVMKLELEIRPITDPFTGIPNYQGSMQPNGAVLAISRGGLVDGRGYHWRARTVDNSRRASVWAAYGDNDESVVDFMPPAASNPTFSFLVNPSNVKAGVSFSPAPQVAVMDASGSPDPSFSGRVTVALRPGTGVPGAVLTGTTQVNAVSGVATFSNLSVDKSGPGYQLQAAAPGYSTTSSSLFAVSASDPADLIFTTDPTNTAANLAITPPVRVTVEDAFGNVFAGSPISVTLAITSGTGAQGAVLSGTRTRSTSSGVATFDDLSIDDAGTGYSLRATASQLSARTSAAFDIVSASAGRLAFSAQPTNTIVNATIAPAVRVRAEDVSGNLNASFNGSVTVSITGGTGTGGANLSGTRTVNAVSGVATFSSLRIDQVGNGYTLSAGANGVAGTTSNAFNIAAPPATRVRFSTHPSDANVGATITPAVTVRAEDASGSLVTSYTGSITVAIGGGTGGAILSGTRTRNAVNGVATFNNLSVDRVGANYTLTATASGLSSHTSNTFDITGGGSGPPSFQVFASGLSVPVGVEAISTDPSRVFVVEQSGRIRVIKNGQLLSAPYLDLSSVVRFGGEQGLLGLAFHPNFNSNRQFFVHYTENVGNGNTKIVRYTASSTGDVANPSASQTIFTLAQPAGNHNGGQLAFGPDGMLYIGLGDGGGFGDPSGNGQNPTNVFASILRINVNSGSPYSIPSDNPFASHPSNAKEIWVYGLRNPWRFSFDRANGNLYIGDVGSVTWEEIDVQPASSNGGENFGWGDMEGAHCYVGGCSFSGKVLPVHEYAHSGGACSVTGGYVYRGSLVPSVQGHYFYSDFCTGWIKSFVYSGGSATNHTDWNAPWQGSEQVTSMGEDANGELYIATANGKIYRMQ